MKYSHVKEGIFIKRPNRFVAHVEIDGQEEICHVKNTGRLTELLVPGVCVAVEPSDNPKRKTRFSLICVKKDGRWVNIDSQVPNAIAWEWVKEGHFLENVTMLKREKTYKKSRFDLYAESGQQKWFVEVKGVTLNRDGVASFPDAPTLRGLKHVEELMEAVKEGYHGAILFVIQMKGVHAFSPFEERQPAFANALREAQKAGVRIIALDCDVLAGEIKIDSPIPVKL